jgi:hypothetical protein
MICQAIVTKYIGASNTRSSRVKATAAAGSVTLNWDHSLNIEANHAKAAKALADKFKWSGHWFGGGLPDDKGYCYVTARWHVLEDVVFITEGER